MTSVENVAEEVARYAPPTETEIDLVLLGMFDLVRPLKMQHVDELVETDENFWDPIEVRPWPAEWKKPDPQVVYHVVSGNHRTTAAHKKGLQTIRARIIEAPDELSYLDAAVRTNKGHGQNFTNEERKTLAIRYKKQGLTTAQIAERFSVNRSTVKNWFSGRDSNASKKKQNEKQAEAMRMLAEAEAGLVDDEWASVPEASVSEREIAITAGIVRDFLAGTPLTMDKAHVISYLRSLSPEEKEALLVDMRLTNRWIQNVSALLEGGL